MTGEPPLHIPGPGGLAVSSLSQAQRHKRKFGVVITIEDPEAKTRDKLRFTAFPRPPHLILRFEDVDAQPTPDADIWLASPDDIIQGLAFAREHAASSILVHCFHGIGRSAGLALAILSDRMGPGREAEALEALLDIRPQAVPNRWVTLLADEILGRGGTLLAALDAWVESDAYASQRRLAKAQHLIDHPSLYARRPLATDDPEP